MKLLLIAYYYPPISSGGTQRPLKWGKYLARMSHDVTVLTHTYGKNRIEEGNPKVMRFRDISYNKDRSDLGKKLCWLVLRAYTEVLNKLGIYHSIYTWWKRNVIKSSEKIIRQTKPDVIIATYPPVETLEIGVNLSQSYNIPLLVDFRDGLMFEPIETRRMQQYKCIRARYKEIEAAAVNRAAAVTSIAQPITHYYNQTYQPPHTEVISNGFDPEDLEDLHDEVAFDKSVCNIVFTGRFALSDKYNRVDYFFDAVRQLMAKKPGVGEKLRIHLVGEYRQEELEGLKDLTDRGMIQVHGFVPRLKSLVYQKSADILLIITPPDRRSATSAKIFEYLFAGKPVLALTHKTVLEDIIRETRSGLIVHPHEAGEIAAMLERLVVDRSVYDAFMPDEEKIKAYSVKAQVEKLDRILKKI